MSIIPSVAMKSLKEGVENRAWKLQITSFAELYIDDMPDFGTLSSELDSYTSYIFLCAKQNEFIMPEL